jgi:twitching motility protein PilT
MTLAELIFSDLFVATAPAESWFKPTPDSLTTMAVPESCHVDLKNLRDLLISHGDSSGFSVRWPEQGPDSIRLRVARIITAHGTPIFVCRRYQIPLGGLTSLGVPAHVAAKLLDKDLSSGLVILFGKAGSGKSTMAGSLVCERLGSFGGVGWTVENPVELDMQGQHGKGWCYQIEVNEDSAIGPAIRELMRASPNIIFIGELRDGAAVAEAITASLSGHLVVSTFHAGDLITGLGRLARWAQSVNPDMGAALADALRVAIHLNLQKYDPSTRPAGAPEVTATGTPPRVLSLEPLFVSGQAEDAIRGMIREGEFQKLSSELKRQERSLLMRGLPT